jgi:UDP-GlcNAc:undecaprenyl-phosphate GlcNAc-1-phosphate transferase
MPYSLSEYLLLGIASIILSGLLTPIARKFARYVGAMDVPNLDRKVHKEPVPYLGGLSIALTITLLTYITECKLVTVQACKLCDHSCTHSCSRGSS